MIGLLTTSRKATAGGLISFFTPLYVLVQSGADIGWRSVLACALCGVLGWLGVWAPPNTEPYVPERRHAADKTSTP